MRTKHTHYNGITYSQGCEKCGRRFIRASNGKNTALCLSCYRRQEKEKAILRKSELRTQLKNEVIDEMIHEIQERTLERESLVDWLRGQRV